MSILDQINRKIERLLEQADKALFQKNSAFKTQLNKVYQAALDDINIEIARMYRKYGDSVEYSEMLKFNRLKDLKSELKTRISFLHGESKDLINTHLKETFSEMFYRTGFAMEVGMQLQINFGVINDRLIIDALKNPLLKVQWPARLNNHHKKAISDINFEINQGLIKGRGYSKTAARIEKKVDISFNKAQRIVRTESHRLTSDAQNLGFERAENAATKLGIETSRKLLSVLDKRTRQQSRDMDGQIADEDGLFEYPDGTKATPGNTGNPGYDINDRESVIFIINNLTPKLRRDSVSKRVIPFTNYNDWYENRIAS